MTETVATLFGERELETETALYLDDFMCEMPPCPCTYDGWAQYLAGKAVSDPDAGIAEGNLYDATIVTYVEGSVVRVDGEYVIPEPPEGFEFHAVRYGKGLGWSPDLLGHTREEIASLLQRFGSSEYEYLAFIKTAHRHGVVRFSIDGPSLSWLDPVAGEQK